MAKGLARQELARAVGISYSSLRRLEHQQHANAPFWWYRNCAIALDVELEEILDDRELSWRAVRRAPAPPGPDWPYRGSGRRTGRK